MFWYDTKGDAQNTYEHITREILKQRSVHYHIFLRRIAKEHPGLSLEEAFEYLSKHPEEFAYDSSYVNEYDQSDPIISIKLIDISRTAENKDRSTFDFVTVELLLRSDLEIEDMNEFVRDNLIEFSRRALEKVASAKKYQKYNVPVEYLSLYGIATRGKSCLEFKYELRNI